MGREMNHTGKNIIYFDEAGSKNTSMTLKAARERADELDIKTIVVASTHGKTALEAFDMLGDKEIIVVTICESFREKGWTMSPEKRDEITSKGMKILTCPHTLGDGVGSSIAEKHGGRSVEEIVRDTLYRFCQGMKVCVEITLMAADAGLIDVDKEVIAIAGTDGGADTAIVIKPSYSRKFYDLAVREIVAKPR